MKSLPWVLILALLPFAGFSQTVLNVTDYGADRHGGADTVPAVTAVLNAVRGMGNVPVRIVFPKGVYRFFPEQAEKKEYYISNHDQDNPKTVGMVLEEFRNLTIDGNGVILEEQMNEASKASSEYNRMVTIYNAYKNLISTSNTRITG